MLAHQTDTNGHRRASARTTWVRAIERVSVFMNELSEAAADLRLARTNFAERIDRGPLSEDARQVIQEHLYSLERISVRLDRLAEGSS